MSSFVILIPGNGEREGIQLNPQKNVEPYASQGGGQARPSPFMAGRADYLDHNPAVKAPLA